MRNFGNSTKNKCAGHMAVPMRTPWVGVRVPLVSAGFIKEGISRTRARTRREKARRPSLPRVFPSLFIKTNQTQQPAPAMRATLALKFVLISVKRGIQNGKYHNTL